MEEFSSHEARASQKGPWDPKLQTPESRQALVEYAKQHGIKPAMRHFGCSRNTIRKWLRRFDTEGQGGLKGLPRGRKPRSSKSLAPAPIPPAPQYPWPSNAPARNPVAPRPTGSLAPVQPTSAQPASAQPTQRPFPQHPRI